jgi:hypothetical protein
MQSSRQHHSDEFGETAEPEPKHKTTLTIVQDFPKKPTESGVSNFNLVDMQTYDVEVIDHKDNQKTVLTIVQDFAKKHKEQFSAGLELTKSRDIDFEDDNHKKTTLTIVQDFPKKIAEQTGHSIEFVQEMGMTPSINTYELEYMGL